MKLTELFIADLERDAEATRHVLERVPEGKDSWKPHEKSMELGYLVNMVATMIEWTDLIINLDEFDIAPEGRERPPIPQIKRQKLLDAHAAALEKARKALQNTNDEHLNTNWKLLARGKVMEDSPRHVMIRDSVLNHLAHHRGQLTVYLRLLSAAVPAIYGPSADEGREVFAA